MPLTNKGKKIMKAMKKEYGPKRGEAVFYASRNKGKIKGVEKASMGRAMFKELVSKPGVKPRRLLLGGLLSSGMRAFVKSKPYKEFVKKTKTEITKAYKQAPETDTARKSFKDKSFMRGLKKLDMSKAKGDKLLDMSQFLVKEARKAGRKDMVRAGRNLRRASVMYLQNTNRKAKAMMQKKLSNKKVN